MPTVKVLNMQGQDVGSVELSEAVFGAEVNVSAMHTVVRAILNAKRQGTQSAKTRTEVRGGGRKIYRQKGTGNARHHGRRAPQFTHGGMVFAVKPRSYRMSVPRKVRRLAMVSALTSKAVENEIIVLDKIELAEAKTKYVAQMLKAVNAAKKAMIVTADADTSVVRAGSNIEGVKVSHVGMLNVVDILGYTSFIVTKDAINKLEALYDDTVEAASEEVNG
ncbi:MAG: 50S ribosomal protein L4 [Clostridia bacterium]|nr:50S ribosomal protein L4 [Clostridia bacterium]MDO4827955.1 50S ribosomal protein L4 [Clostridia bacterium]MDY2768613.1 50S ribosomal protein L4 [Eubacteriales bacterium]